MSAPADRPAPFVAYHVPGSRRALFAVSFSALGDERATEIERRLDSWPGGGRSSPGARADYYLDLNAAPGERVIPAWQPSLNVLDFDVPDGRYGLGFDFGGSRASFTACVAGYLAPRALLIFMEHAAPNLPTRVHKERIRAKLRELKPTLPQNFAWPDHFDVVGDCTGVGYKIDYADQPDPLVIRNPSTEPGWRDREASEALINSMAAVAKRCCYREWTDTTEKCGVCGKTLVPAVGLLIHPRCAKLREQIPAQVRDHDGRRDDDAPRDVFDALMYLVRFYQKARPVLSREVAEARPWWLQKPKQDAARPMANDEDSLAYYGGRARKLSEWV